MQAEVDMVRMEQARYEMNYSSAFLRHLSEELEMVERELSGQSAFRKEKDEQRVRRDRKDFLKDKCREKTFQWIETFPSESLIKGMVKI